MRKSVLSTVEYRICSDKIPEPFHGFRAAVLADLHNCTIGAKNSLLLRELTAQSPDLILLAGDMVTEEKFRDGIFWDEAMEVLKKMSEIAPVFYGIGNHEQRWIEKEVPDRKTFDSFRRELEECGITFLDNRSVKLRKENTEIRITGLALPNRFYNKKKIVHLSAAQIHQLVGKADGERFQILLAHTPQFFRAYSAWGADLTLAGHYHGGVIRIPGIGGLISTNFRLFPRYDYGKFADRDSDLHAGREMIVTSGLGCHTIPVRLNNPPEIVILNLSGGEPDGTFCKT